MTELVTALTVAAPYYNLSLVIIVLFLFGKLFSTKIINKKVYLAPWHYIFVAVLIFIVEEVLTVLRQARVIDIPFYINGFFELAIISLFIYTLLLQKERIER